jgi:hypothetical protein
MFTIKNGLDKAIKAQSKPMTEPIKEWAQRVAKGIVRDGIEYDRRVKRLKNLK